MEKLLGSAFVRIRSHLTRAGHTVIYVQANAGGHLSTEEKAVAPLSSLLRLTSNGPQVSLLVWTMEMALHLPTEDRRLVWIVDFETPSVSVFVPELSIL